MSSIETLDITDPCINLSNISEVDLYVESTIILSATSKR